jgi:hypothetical protein
MESVFQLSEEMREAWMHCHGPSCPPSIFAQPLWTQLVQLHHSAPDVHGRFLKLTASEQVSVLRSVRMSYRIAQCGGAA